MAAAADRSRVDWVDYAKGICIIFVVMMHSTLGVEKAAGAEGWMHAIVQFAKPFRMPDFFLISGLFLALVIDRPWLRFFDRKVVHFAYFYVLWTAIQFAIKAPSWMGEGKSGADIAFLYAETFVQPFGTLWFIYLLPIFFVTARLLKSVHWIYVLAAGAVLEMLPVNTGWLVVDEFAARFVYFYAGYALARHIFALAAWTQANSTAAVGALAVWFAVNFATTFTSAPAGLSAFADPHSTRFLVSDLPLVSLALGGLGAMAIVMVSALVARLPLAFALAYLGRNSIVVYLAFFLPMAVARAVLLKFAPSLDIGTVSLLVTMAGVAGPVVFHALVLWTGFGRFLFERPNWAKLERDRPRQSVGGLQPAE